MATEAQTKITSISKSPYSKEGLIKRLNEFRTRYNRYPTRKDFSEKKIEPSKNAYYRTFGNMQKAVDAAEEQWIKERFKPKKRHKKQATRQPSGFQCPFCGNYTDNAEIYHSSLITIVTMRFLFLLRSKSKQCCFESVMEGLHAWFGTKNPAVREELKKEGYLEKFDQRFNEEGNAEDWEA